MLPTSYLDGYNDDDDKNLLFRLNICFFLIIRSVDRVSTTLARQTTLTTTQTTMTKIVGLVIKRRRRIHQSLTERKRRDDSQTLDSSSSETWDSGLKTQNSKLELRSRGDIRSRTLAAKISLTTISSLSKSLSRLGAEKIWSIARFQLILLDLVPLL